MKELKASSLKFNKIILLPADIERRGINALDWKINETRKLSKDYKEILLFDDDSKLIDGVLKSAGKKNITVFLVKDGAIKRRYSISPVF